MSQSYLSDFARGQIFTIATLFPWLASNNRTCIDCSSAAIFLS